MKLFLPFLLSFICALSTMEAQPKGLPWDLDPECQSIVTTGIVAITCGVLEGNPPSDNFTLAMLDLNGALPNAGRIDVTSTTDRYHHPSWQVDSLGNVFGITMDYCGNTYTTASAQYSSSFFGEDAVIRYGDIGGGANDLSAAGTIYKIDGSTGQATVFSVLPQQSYSFTHIPCEGGSSVSRKTGPGLGNLVYSLAYNCFFVTNLEDGRIYRLDSHGNIKDSYDPKDYDNGQPGPPVLSDIAYGIALSNDNTKLFFGTMGDDTPTGIYSIDLELNGSFPGMIDNSSLPAGATWDNYVGTELLHIQLNGTGTFFISDLEFSPSGNLLAGNRVGCDGNIHSSYNHQGRSWIIEPDNSGMYNIATVIYTSDGTISDDNAYGGVSVFDNPNGTMEVVISSADMLSEDGPHGICTQEEGVNGSPGGNPASPAGIIAYLPGGIPNDVKGIGGDVFVFKGCACNADACPTCVGDLNGDGNIDLLDVTPFTNSLNSGIFNPCADINGDGYVDLLDVDPFTDLIQSGASCCVCVGDVNGDGEINLLDVFPFTVVLNSGVYNSCADINGDGAVDEQDVSPFVDLLRSDIGCCECVGDINGDGLVDLLDVEPFNVVLSSGIFTPCADINGDSVVNLLDVQPFTDLILNGAECCLCLGDINGDGNFDLLDIDPFTDLVASGKYHPCGDINGDGVVDLLDVQPFIDLLTNGGGCGGAALGNGGKLRGQDLSNNAIDNIYERLGIQQSVSDLRYFPNPASHSINLYLDKTNSPSIIVNLYNTAGQKVLAKEVRANAGQQLISIDLNELAPGLYLLEVNDGDSLKTGKFILEK